MPPENVHGILPPTRRLTELPTGLLVLATLATHSLLQFLTYPPTEPAFFLLNFAAFAIYTTLVTRSTLPKEGSPISKFAYILLLSLLLAFCSCITSMVLPLSRHGS